MRKETGEIERENKVEIEEKEWERVGWQSNNRNC